MENLKKMKACILHEPGNIVYEEKDIEKINSGEALINIKRAGICGSDLDRMMLTGAYKKDIICGHEMCGIIAEINEKETTKFKKGDKVIVCPILPCYECEFCKNEDYGQCINYNYLGSRTNGGFAEYVKAPIKNLIKMPGEMTFEEGAFIEPLAVTLHALNRIKIKDSDKYISVIGCGLIGLIMIKLVKIKYPNKKIIAVDIDNEKLKVAKNFGADFQINSKIKNLKKEIIKISPLGVNVVFEVAGVSKSQIDAIDICCSKGSIVYIGTAHSDITLKPNLFEKIIRGEITITGSWNSYSKNFPGSEWFEIIDLIKTKKLDVKPLISDTIKLSDLPNTIDKMAKKSFSYNKILVDTSL